MSQKKHKKRHPQGRRSRSTPVQESEFSTDGKRKRMNPVARNILLITLVILAVSQLGYQQHLVSETAANLFAILGLIMTMISLWIQFKSPTGRGGGPTAPRLR